MHILRENRDKGTGGANLDLALIEELDSVRGRQLASGDGVNDIRDNPTGVWAVGARVSGGQRRVAVVDIRQIEEGEGGIVGVSTIQ